MLSRFSPQRPTSKEASSEKSPAPAADAFEVLAATPNFKTELAARLAELIPEALADGKLDVVKLKELLGDDVADENERFGLFWPGKKRALRAAQAPTTATLKPDFVNSKDWDTTQNVFIEGDNLEVLKILQRHYHSKIKLIYIDPPYNTGKDFVYPDNYKEGLETYLEWTRQVNEEGRKVSSNSESEGRYHSNWLNMMYPRLKLARNLLTDDGVIFISIDDNEQDNLKKLCNEVFGEGRFITQIPWRKRTAKSDVPYGVSQDFEWILGFAKSDSFRARVRGKERRYFETPDLAGRRWRIHDLTKQTTASERPKSFFTIVNPQNGSEYPANPNRTWAITSDTFDDYYEKKRIVFPGDYDFLNIKQPVFRYFENDDMEKAGEDFGFVAVSTLLPESVGMTKEGGAEIIELFEEKIFSFPKPSALIKHLVEISAREDNIILDFFAGSSTTAHAVMQLNAEDGGNRRFIMVQLPEPTPEDSEARKAGFNTIADISRRRIELAGEKIVGALHATPLPDVGFRAYKLTDTHFAK
ncbi:MAG: site-specific DNA-methyltransferase [Burkholderiales bacterium]|jgi:adenine-specific DNA-methyltransferase|nr:site-specific DNA-methyltransferase [Burkholderiales bacterium]